MAINFLVFLLYFYFFIAHDARSAVWAMKRDEREYVEELPEATRKARLEQEAATLLSLPKDIRKMVMMKLKPIDMYALYSGVDNHAFKKWCDDHFWDYALRAMFPNVRAPEEMAHPRWRFFAYALGSRFTQGKDNYVYFEQREVDAVQGGRAVVRLGFFISGEMYVQFEVSDVQLGRFLIELAIAERNVIPFIERQDRLIGRIFFTQTPGQIARLHYKLFELGYRRVVNPHQRREFLLGCHLCGSPAVTGYAAEDPTKLLCGRECVNK